MELQRGGKFALSYHSLVDRDQTNRTVWRAFKCCLYDMGNWGSACLKDPKKKMSLLQTLLLLVIVFLSLFFCHWFDFVCCGWKQNTVCHFFQFQTFWKNKWVSTLCFAVLSSLCWSWMNLPSLLFQKSIQQTQKNQMTNKTKAIHKVISHTTWSICETHKLWTAQTSFIVTKSLSWSHSCVFVTFIRFLGDLKELCFVMFSHLIQLSLNVLISNIKSPQSVFVSCFSLAIKRHFEKKKTITKKIAVSPLQTLILLLWRIFMIVKFVCISPALCWFGTLYGTISVSKYKTTIFHPTARQGDQQKSSFSESQKNNKTRQQLVASCRLCIVFWSINLNAINLESTWNRVSWVDIVTGNKKRQQPTAQIKAKCTLIKELKH